MISNCASPNCRHNAVQGNMFCPGCAEGLRALTGKAGGVIPTLRDVIPEVPKTSDPFADAERAIAKQNAADLNDRRSTDARMSFKYPKYYKAIPSGVTEVDIYMVCEMFQVQDYSGAIHHAVKKLLLPGVRTGGKSRRDDVKEARDTLSRWLEIHK